jgi:predicted O-linked N-acetylglucosamine transferase (SPINDLY family)
MNFLYLIESAINSRNYAEVNLLVKRLVKAPTLASQSQICQIAVMLTKNSQIEMAQFLLKELSANGKKNPDLTYLMGKIFSSRNLHEEAKTYFEKARTLMNNAPDVLFDLANTYSSLGQHSRAIQIFNQLVDKKYRLADVYFNRGNCLLTLGCFVESLEDFDSSNRLQAGVDSLNNIGFLLRRINRVEDAVEVLSNAIATFGPKRNLILNRAACFYDLKAYESSIEDLKLGVSLYPQYPNYYDALGMSYMGIEAYNEAGLAFEKVIELDPLYPYAYGKLHSVKIKLCDWLDDEQLVAKLKNGLSSNVKVSMPFHILGVIDDQRYQFLAGQIWAEEKFTNNVEKVFKNTAEVGKKIKVGYFSADFHSHATMYLMEDLFKHHNLDDFEIYAFSNAEVSNDAVKDRVKAYFNSFFDIHKDSDEKVVGLCNQLGLDIAVDLKGYTQDSRLNLFAKRLAPIQISYLGYPGTIAASFMDYVIADKCVIPEKNQEFFSEKVIYLNRCYQVNSEIRGKKLDHQLLKREDFQIGDETFLYASFNNQYKIRPYIFAAWMKILKAVANSKLMIYADNEDARENIKIQAKKMGVEENRLIFISKVSQEEHISRQSIVDLCLDTFPYGGHTTCSDALGQGIPYLSLCGESFPSRVSASILNSLNLTELVTYSIDEYINTAITLGSDRPLYKKLKAKLETELKVTSLFQPKQFVSELELAYKNLVFSSQII